MEAGHSHGMVTPTGSAAGRHKRGLAANISVNPDGSLQLNRPLAEPRFDEPLRAFIGRSSTTPPALNCGRARCGTMPSISLIIHWSPGSCIIGGMKHALRISRTRDIGAYLGVDRENRSADADIGMGAKAEAHQEAQESRAPFYFGARREARLGRRAAFAMRPSKGNGSSIRLQLSRIG